MADGINRVMLLGNLGDDPEHRSVGSGLLTWRMACTESYRDKEGGVRERTDWVTCVLWGKRADALARFLRRGSRVFVEGRIQTRSWDHEGTKRYATEVNVTNVVLCDGKRQATAQPQEAGAAVSPAAPESDALNLDDIPF